MDARNLYHPSIRSYPESWIDQRTSMWSRWWYPFEERISWCGDIQLNCRSADYLNVILEAVPGAPLTGAGGDRRIVSPWDGLDDYRLRVKTWLSQFDDQGKQIKRVKAPKLTHVEPAGKDTTIGMVGSGNRGPNRDEGGGWTGPDVWDPVRQEYVPNPGGTAPVEPKMTPVTPKPAGTKLSRWMRRGKP